VKKEAINPQSIIHPEPHLGFVRGSGNVAFLKKRFRALSAHTCYHGKEYADGKKQIRSGYRWLVRSFPRQPCSFG
jgi:hypothetical protein